MQALLIDLSNSNGQSPCVFVDVPLYAPLSVSSPSCVQPVSQSNMGRTPALCLGNCVFVLAVWLHYSNGDPVSTLFSSFGLLRRDKVGSKHSFPPAAVPLPELENIRCITGRSDRSGEPALYSEFISQLTNISWSGREKDGGEWLYHSVSSGVAARTWQIGKVGMR